MSPIVSCGFDDKPLCTACDFFTLVSNALKWLVALITLVITLVVVWSGIRIATAGGNMGTVKEARSMFTNAIIGFAILLCAWLIIDTLMKTFLDQGKIGRPWNTISADACQTPKATGPTAPTPPAGGGTPTDGGTPAPVPPDPSGGGTTQQCPSGIRVKCQPCVGCSPVTGVTNKGCGGYTCYLETSLLKEIQRVSGVSGWRITESWPPTVSHLSSCHQNGQCADLNNSGGPTDPQTIKQYYDAFRAAGLKVLYESTNCPPYIAAGVTNCRKYGTMTNGSSFHVSK